jgi:hypothetical protein
MHRPVASLRATTPRSATWTSASVVDLADRPHDLPGDLEVGYEPAGLLRSAELLLRRLAPIAASDTVDDLRATVADLVWEANTGVGA